MLRLTLKNNHNPHTPYNVLFDYQVTDTRSSTNNEGSLLNDIIIKLTPVIQRTVSTAVVQQPAIQRTVSVVQQRPVSSQSTVTIQSGVEDQQGIFVSLE